MAREKKVSWKKLQWVYIILEASHKCKIFKICKQTPGPACKWVFLLFCVLRKIVPLTKQDSVISLINKSDIATVFPKLGKW